MVRVKKRSFSMYGGRHRRWSIIRRNYHASSRLLLTITPVWKEICLSWPLQLTGTSGYFLKFWTSYKPYVPFSTRMKRVCLYASARVLLCDDHQGGSASRDLPSPVSHKASWSLLKYICCKSYGCTRTLARIN